MMPSDFSGRNRGRAMLDIKKLQYLEAVYRHRSFTRASEELFVSQSAISMSIKSLEEELGV